MSPRNPILSSVTFSCSPSSCLHLSSRSKVPSRSVKKPPRLVLQRTWPHSPSTYANGEWSRWVGSTKPCQVCLEQDYPNNTQRVGCLATGTTSVSSRCVLRRADRPKRGVRIAEGSGENVSRPQVCARKEATDFHLSGVVTRLRSGVNERGDCIVAACGLP